MEELVLSVSSSFRVTCYKSGECHFAAGAGPAPERPASCGKLIQHQHSNTVLHCCPHGGCPVTARGAAQAKPPALEDQRTPLAQWPSESDGSDWLASAASAEARLEAPPGGARPPDAARFPGAQPPDHVAHMDALVVCMCSCRAAEAVCATSLAVPQGWCRCLQPPELLAC